MDSIDDFRVDSVQVTAWTAQGEISPSRVLIHATTHYGEILTREPEFLPLDLPGDIPRILMSNEDDSIRLEAPRNRINLFSRAGPDTPATVSVDAREAVSQFKKWLQELFAASDATIGRLGIVVIRTAVVADPAGMLTTRFLDQKWVDGIFADPEAFELHVLTHPDAESQGVYNFWNRFKTGSLISSPQTKVAILEQDFNSAPTDVIPSSGFSPIEIDRFFETALDSIDNAFQRLFRQT